MGGNKRGIDPATFLRSSSLPVSPRSPASLCWPKVLRHQQDGFDLELVIVVPLACVKYRELLRTFEAGVDSAVGL